MLGPAADLGQPGARPRLKPWYRLGETSHGIVLRYGASVLEFGGGAASTILPPLVALLDGTRTLEQIVSELGEAVRPAIENALHLLDERGLLAEPVDPALSPDVVGTAEFLAASDPYGRDAATVATALAGRRIAIVGTSAVAGRVGELLEPLVHTTRAEWDEPAAHESDLAVVAPSPGELSQLARWNRAAIERGTEWLQVLPFDGQLAAVGPIVVPSQSACHECFALRRSASISPVRDTAVGSYPAAAAADALLASYAALVALRRVALADGASVGVLLAVEHGPGLTATRHVVHRVPRCPACSPTEGRAAPAPWSEVHGIAV